MGLLETILRPRTTRQVRRLSLQVAERSLDGVRDRLSSQAHTLSPAELRGYIRARAALVVSRQVDLAIATEGRLPNWGRTELLKQVTSHVVQQLGHELALGSRVPALLRKAG